MNHNKLGMGHEQKFCINTKIQLISIIFYNISWGIRGIFCSLLNHWSNRDTILLKTMFESIFMYFTSLKFRSWVY